MMSSALIIATWPGARGENGIDDLWIERARQLQTREFMQICSDVLMSPDHMKQQSYLMSDFADEVTNLCLNIAPNPDQGTCQRNDFSSLKSSLQNAFFRHATQHLGKKEMPINLMMEWGDAGYVVSDKSAIEQEVMRNDLCGEVHESIGDEFIQQIPVSNMLTIDSYDQLASVESEEVLDQLEASDQIKAPLLAKHESDVEEEIDNDNFTIIHGEKEDEILSISGIIVISCAVAAAIALIFYYEARRRNRARINKLSRFNNGHKGFVEDGVLHVNTSTSGKTVESFRSNASVSVEEIKAAINDADWDSVYKLASLVAENDDGLEIPRLESFKGQNRGHLGAEDQERTRTLDDLAANGDWTGLAVTAALYAGETSGSSDNQSDNCYSFTTDENSITSSIHSSENQDIEEGQRSMKNMVSNLSRALNDGNWSKVTKYANLIKDEKNSDSSFDSDSQMLLTSSSASSIISIDTSKTEMSKKQTIAKLMRAGKWKGVSIMANMYEIESKQGHPSSTVRPYPPSPPHLYSDTRSIIRTKELRHSDRVQENIVGFRRDP